VAIAMPAGVVVSREGDWWPRGIITNGEFCCPTIVHDFDKPQSVLWVALPSGDGVTVEGDFTAVFVEEDFTSGIAEDGDQEEVVDEAGQLVGETCVGR
jgi:hypothetical protein